MFSKSGKILLSIATEKAITTCEKECRRESKSQLHIVALTGGVLSLISFSSCFSFFLFQLCVINLFQLTSNIFVYLRKEKKRERIFLSTCYKGKYFRQITCVSTIVLCIVKQGFPFFFLRQVLCIKKRGFPFLL